MPWRVFEKMIQSVLRNFNRCYWCIWRFGHCSNNLFEFRIFEHSEPDGDPSATRIRVLAWRTISWIICVLGGIVTNYSLTQSNNDNYEIIRSCHAKSSGNCKQQSCVQSKLLRNRLHSLLDLFCILWMFFSPLLCNLSYLTSRKFYALSHQMPASKKTYTIRHRHGMVEESYASIQNLKFKKIYYRTYFYLLLFAVSSAISLFRLIS